MVLLLGFPEWCHTITNDYPHVPTGCLALLGNPAPLWCLFCSNSQKIIKHFANYGCIFLEKFDKTLVSHECFCLRMGWLECSQRGLQFLLDLKKEVFEMSLWDVFLINSPPWLFSHSQGKRLRRWDWGQKRNLLKTSLQDSTWFHTGGWAWERALISLLFLLLYSWWISEMAVKLYMLIWKHKIYGLF